MRGLGAGGLPELTRLSNKPLRLLGSRKRALRNLNRGDSAQEEAN
jgi:hypothetical protein